MRIHLLPKDLPIFEKYANKSSIILEYGSGGSTVYLSNLPNIKKVISIESDKKWYDKVKNNANMEKLILSFCDLECENTSLGRPGENCPISKILYYQLAGTLFSKQYEIDTIFVDGRYRLNCCLINWFFMNEKTKLLIDDFERSLYHNVFPHFKIIEKGKKLAVLQKDLKNPPTAEKVIKYELEYL